MKKILASVILASVITPTAALATLKAGVLTGPKDAPADQSINYVVKGEEVCVTFGVDSLSDTGEACVKKSKDLDKDIKVALNDAKYDLLLKSDF